ncbi:MAG TPA: HAD family phosphatase [Burkholderiales bacterium]|nr:HAD family phosphatase [Burkholderiales bacterium]
MRDAPRLLLFDLGGVLVDVSGYRNLGPLLRRSLEDPQVLQGLRSCPVLRAFETGQLTASQFAERFVSAWDCAVGAQEFLRQFRGWTQGFFPGARELLAGLRPRHRLACLSNSNEVHWERMERELAVFELFETALSSHQLGCYKPDPEIYERAFAALKVEPAQVIFFDDLAVNVEAARRAGAQAYRVKGIEELRDCVRRLNL